jgi:hypothetical protein
LVDERSKKAVEMAEDLVDSVYKIDWQSSGRLVQKIDEGFSDAAQVLGSLDAARKAAWAAQGATCGSWQYTLASGEREQADDPGHPLSAMVGTPDWCREVWIPTSDPNTFVAEDEYVKMAHREAARAACATLGADPLVPALGWLGEGGGAAVAAVVCAALVRRRPKEPEFNRRLQDEARHAEERAQADILRDIVRNPFRPAVDTPIWITPEIRKLARKFYNERIFGDGVRRLDDVLRQAGCHDGELLVHFRNSDVHWRGCWALDLLLGKS